MPASDQPVLSITHASVHAHRSMLPLVRWHDSPDVEVQNPTEPDGWEATSFDASIL
jgi:hypothetical protein